MTETIPTEIWIGGYCFRYDPTAPDYGYYQRRVYRLVGFEKFHSISYNPQSWPRNPWRSTVGHKTSASAAAYVIKRLGHEIKQAKELIAAHDHHVKCNG